RIAFSTSAEVRRDPSSRAPLAIRELPNDVMSPLFQAVAEATEEAILNSLFRATTTTGNGTTVEALPVDRTLEILRRYNALHWDRTVPPGRP
ncbi:MAG TPA: P1 family peptidase, partial [Longimicrobium sp.]|nr:P1 family peptidase [Longimicrobium sp.]